MSEIILNTYNKKFIELFEDRFGKKRANKVFEKISNTNVRCIELPYYKWLGTVDSESGDVIINDMSNIANITNAIMHELMHKVNDFSDESINEKSYFLVCPEGYEKYAWCLLEYATEWMTQEMLDEEKVVYSMTGSNDIIKVRGDSNSYTEGVNIIEALTAVVGKENFIDVYTGEKTFETFISEYENMYGQGNFLNLMSLMNKTTYNQAIENILDAYIVKQNLTVNYSEAALNKMYNEIKRLVAVSPLHLIEEKSSIDKKLDLIQERYAVECQKQGIIPQDFTKETISEDKKKTLLCMANARNLEPDQTKKIFEFEVKYDESGDLRNNLYRILSYIDKYNVDIFDTILKSNNKYVIDILDKIKELPPQIETDIDIEKYRNIYYYVYEYFNVQMLLNFKDGQKGDLMEYTCAKDTFDTIKKNSIFDTKKKDIVGNLNNSVEIFNNSLKINHEKNERLAKLSGKPKEDFDMDRWHMEGLYVKPYMLTMNEEEYDKKINGEIISKYNERHPR